MNTRHSWLFALSFFVSLTSALHAASTPAMSMLTINNHHNRCSYIDNRWDCGNTRGCYWNYRDNYCASDRDGDDDYRSCYDIYSPLECSNRSDCYWSRREQACVDNNGGGSPRHCYYIRSPYECNNTYNCHWSRSYDRCVGPDDL